jgi:magnesium-transporting ATPase (P-type)
VVRALLVLLMLLYLAELVAWATRLMLIGKLSQGLPISLEEADFSDSFVRLTVFSGVGLLVITAIAFLMWLHRIVSNNGWLGSAGARFSPAWAVGCWFVPLANYVLPVMAVAEAWRCAAPELSVSGRESGTDQRTPALIWLWWGFWIGAAVMGLAGGLLGSKPIDVAAFQNAAIALMISTVLELIAAVLAIAVVVKLTKRQEARAELFARAAGRSR